MKRLLQYLKKNKYFFYYTLILGLILIPFSYQTFCGIYDKYPSFDLETLLTWDFAALKGFIPYKDLYYPYGLLTYYKSSHPLFFIIFLFLPSLLFILMSLSISQLLKKNRLNFLTSSLLFLVIIFVTGVDNFSRYGVSLVFALLLPLLMELKSKLKVYFALGAMTSLIFWLIHDQGLYCFVIFVVYFFLYNVQRLKKINNVFFDVFCYSCGLILGILPFIIWLLLNDALGGFLYFLTISLPEFPLLSKTPFFNLFFTTPNLFAWIVLTISLTWLISNLVVNKSLDKKYFVWIGLITLLLMLEQKNIMRSIGTTLILPSYILLAFLIHDSINKFRLLFVIPVLVFIFLFISENHLLQFGTLKFEKIESCQTLAINANSKKQNVINRLKSYDDFNGKILSFPGDPVFYVMLNQKPPFYTSIYEASSKNSQKDLINFLSSTNFVVMDMRNTAIQDNVPNYVRGKYLLTEILKNFSIRDRVENYLIFSRGGEDIFFQRGADEFRNHLLSINLEAIPSSEGSSHKKLLDEKESYLYKDLNSERLNQILRTENISSDNKILLIKTQGEGYIKIKIETADLESNLTIRKCEEICFINMSSIPLFYRTRQIKEINASENVSFSLIELSEENLDNIW